MLCGEADPLHCHRGLMITPVLVERGIFPVHLRKDGTAETTAELEARLLAETGVGNGVLDGLFAEMLTEEERQQFLQEAYRVRAKRAGYRLPPAGAAPATSSEDGHSDDG
jgi:hypothetical protein